MDSSYAKSPFEELPLELKIEIIRSLDSIYDLDALSQTCTTFYSLSKSSICTALRPKLISGTKLGKAVIAVVILQSFGYLDSLGPSIDPEQLPLEIRDYGEFLSRLTSIYDIAKWFGRRFLGAMAERFGDEARSE